MGPPGAVTWHKGGWTIHGQRRVSSKASFDLRNGFVEFDMDLSQAQGGVNNNFFLTFHGKENCGKTCYCDSSYTGGCAEIDLTENNGHCAQASSWYFDHAGYDKTGHGYLGKLSKKVISVHAEWDGTGKNMRLKVDGNKHTGPGFGDLMGTHGAVLYSSQGTPGVPGNCAGDANLGTSSFSVSNLKIKGKVVSGRAPAACSGSYGGNASAPLFLAV